MGAVGGRQTDRQTEVRACVRGACVCLCRVFAARETESQQRKDGEVVRMREE
jgi:hypothetical protein